LGLAWQTILVRRLHPENGIQSASIYRKILAAKAFLKTVPDQGRFSSSVLFQTDTALRHEHVQSGLEHGASRCCR